MFNIIVSIILMILVTLIVTWISVAYVVAGVHLHHNPMIFFGALLFILTSGAIGAIYAAYMLSPADVISKTMQVLAFLTIPLAYFGNLSGHFLRKKGISKEQVVFFKCR